LVIGVFLLFATMLGAAGGGLVGLSGVMAARGEAGAGALSLVIGLVALYGAYLFARAAWRTSRAFRVATPDERSDWRKRACAIVGYAFLVAAGSVFTPVPAPVRVIGAVVALLVVPVVLAREFEPPKRKRSKRAA
jgi:peptidoglycan/LPS O-acetylase OafA/YrhL